jgi:PIN domain nuclease of toxin-antitoxin system
VRLLLDTQILIWFAAEREKLKKAEWELLASGEHELLISTISIWELRVKWRAEQRRGISSLTLLPGRAIEFAEGLDIPILPLLPEDCLGVLDPPVPHRDPFDEMLLVHAVRARARLLTRDGDLGDHPFGLFA